ncbi:hypothetical protein [Methylomagnum sp.]
MKIDLILTKAFKFVTFVFFSFAMLVYFGILIIIPLDIMFHIARLLFSIGLPTPVAVAVGVGALAYIGHAIWKLPALSGLILDIGKELISFGHKQIERFDTVVGQPSSNA